MLRHASLRAAAGATAGASAPLAATAALTLSALAGVGCEPRPGRLIETWEASNGTFGIRVSLLEEGNPAHLFEKGLHYRFESAPGGTSDWRLITSAYSSRRVKLPRDQVRFVNPRCAFVFMQWWLASTTDAGATWSVWDVPAHLGGRVHYRQDLVRSVEIGPDGRGRMLLSGDATSDGRELTLHTRDYGRTWSERE